MCDVRVKSLNERERAELEIKKRDARISELESALWDEIEEFGCGACACLDWGVAENRGLHHPKCKVAKLLGLETDAVLESALGH